MQHHTPPDPLATESFPTDPSGLPEAGRPQLLELAPGDTLDLTVGPVAKRLGDTRVRMLGYNGSVPGPTLKVREGSTVTIKAENRGDLETTVHWHGLRLDNRYDGTHAVQRPIEVGESFEYQLEFPDPGAYWYHPHIRQDYTQELGLYGQILVVPADPGYWPPAHRELALTLDDILIEDGRVAPFSREETTHAAMGRFGNVILVNGEPGLELSAATGEVVRLYLTNTANTRVFNVAMTGGRMKVVGGDSGRSEHEELVDSAILGPSERVVMDVLFEAAGEAALEHRTPERTYTLASITVGDDPVDPSLAQAFGQLRTNSDMVAERERITLYRDAEPDKTIAFVAEMDFETPEGTVAYTCPMHPEVVSEEPGKCPQCGMKLVPTEAAVVFTCPMHPDVLSDEQGKCPRCGMKLVPTLAVAGRSAAVGDHESAADEHQHDHEAGGIEWEDDMVELNRRTTPANTRWKIVEPSTGTENFAIDWRFRVGDQVKIRLVNEMDSDHPMHHPFHIHGAGRFLVLARDGVEDPNLVWTDTVLVKTGEVVDILLDVTHAGRWMAHCHIAEHHESGMIFGFDVEPV